MKPIFPFLFVFCILFTACNKKYDEVGPVHQSKIDEGYTTYTIKKNSHRSVNKIKKFDGSVLTFKACFDQTAIYQPVDQKNRLDIHKLYGFSDCGSAHHTNSARFGWRWVNDELQILAYCYINGTVENSFIKSVSLNEVHNFQIEVAGDKYVFTVDDISVEMKRGCNSSSANGYRLWPYFGGDESAPHDVNISIKEE